MSELTTPFVPLYHVHDGAIVGDGNGNIGFANYKFMDDVPVEKWLSDDLRVSKSQQFYIYKGGWEEKPAPDKTKMDVDLEEKEVKTANGVFYQCHVKFLADFGMWVVSNEPPKRVEQ